MTYYLKVKDMKNFLNHFDNETLIGFCNLNAKNTDEFNIQPSLIMPTEINIQGNKKLIDINEQEIKENNFKVIDIAFEYSKNTPDNLGVHKICKINNSILSKHWYNIE